MIKLEDKLTFSALKLIEQLYLDGELDEETWMKIRHDYMDILNYKVKSGASDNLAPNLLLLNPTRLENLYEHR